MSYKDYYKILGIKTDASATEIEEAYLKLSARYSADEFEEDELSQIILQNITEAFMVLDSNEFRLEYDTKGSDWELPDAFYEDIIQEEETIEPEEELIDEDKPSEEEIADSFKSFFEKGFKEVVRLSKQHQDQQGHNTHITIPFSINDALEGTTKTITIEAEEIEIPIPKGAFPGQQLRLAGKGKRSTDGQTTGDLWITLVEQPHAYFFRRGNNILYHASVDIYTALLGGNITVPTPTGKVKMNIPKGIISNAALKIAGGGIPHFNNPEARGDFFVELHIEMPKDLSEEEIVLIKRLRGLRSS
ncbi:MAG: curved DNA-binding protein [Polaribacter sp.]|jgi:curved DNA-binding protein